jgi:hypothetical protein
MEGLEGAGTSFSGDLRHERFRREEQPGNGRRVSECRPHHLRRIDDTGVDEVSIVFGLCVETPVCKSGDGSSPQRWSRPDPRSGRSSERVLRRTGFQIHLAKQIDLRSW